MKKILLVITAAVAIACFVNVNTFAQGRGRGVGLGRKSDVFVNGHDARLGRLQNRGRDMSWKCGVFVNCHDARNGRLDGRGPRFSRNGAFRNGVFVPRGERVRNQVFIRNSNRRAARLDRLEMLRQERIAERRHFGMRQPK